GDYTDNTFSVWYRELLDESAVGWGTQERKRLIYDMTLSGNSTFAAPFHFTPGSKIRFYFGSSGVTAYDMATAKLLLGIPEYDQTRSKVKEYNLYLGTANSGISTQPSATGVSNMIVDGEAYIRSDEGYIIDNMDETSGEFYVFQIDTLTICQASQASGNYSGNTVTFRYRESTINTDAAWAAAATVDIITAMAISGNTRYSVDLDLKAIGFVRFDLLPSGVTAWDFVKAKFRCK
ncbi:unnamed protein product, partial [marine sediment metagenome]